MIDIYIWIKDILLVIISLSFFEVLIPNSRLEQYIKFVFSIVILAIILDPLTSLFSSL